MHRGRHWEKAGQLKYGSYAILVSKRSDTEIPILFLIETFLQSNATQILILLHLVALSDISLSLQQMALNLWN